MTIPREPSPTCPLIDRLRRELESDIADPDRLTYLHCCLEDIRAANVALREWGSAYRTLSEEKDTIIDRLNTQEVAT